MHKICHKSVLKTRSSAVTEVRHDASCQWIFCYITQGHSKWHHLINHIPWRLSCIISEIKWDFAIV